MYCVKLNNFFSSEFQPIVPHQQFCHRMVTERRQHILNETDDVNKKQGHVYIVKSDSVLYA